MFNHQIILNYEKLFKNKQILETNSGSKPCVKNLKFQILSSSMTCSIRYKTCKNKNSEERTTARILYARGSIRRKFRTAKNPYGESSKRRIFRTAEIPYREKSLRRKVQCKNSYGENFGPGHATGQLNRHFVVGSISPHRNVITPLYAWLGFLRRPSMENIIKRT